MVAIVCRNIGMMLYRKQFWLLLCLGKLYLLRINKNGLGLCSIYSYVFGYNLNFNALLRQQYNMLLEIFSYVQVLCNKFIITVNLLFITFVHVRTIHKRCRKHNNVGEHTNMYVCRVPLHKPNCQYRKKVFELLWAVHIITQAPKLCSNDRRLPGRVCNEIAIRMMYKLCPNGLR